MNINELSGWANLWSVTYHLGPTPSSSVENPPNVDYQFMKYWIPLFTENLLVHMYKASSIQEYFLIALQLKYKGFFSVYFSAKSSGEEGLLQMGLPYLFLIKLFGKQAFNWPYCV